jgi:hypothetical protein
VGGGAAFCATGGLWVAHPDRMKTVEKKTKKQMPTNEKDLNLIVFP